MTEKEALEKINQIRFEYIDDPNVSLSVLESLLDIAIEQQNENVQYNAVCACLDLSTDVDYRSKKEYSSYYGIKGMISTTKKLEALVGEKPELKEKIFKLNDIILDDLSTFDLDYISYIPANQYYHALGKITDLSPNSAERVLDILKLAVQSDGNDVDSLETCNETLRHIVNNRPDLAEQVFDIFKTVLQSDKNDSSSLCECYRTLRLIVCKKPEMADQVFDAFKVALQSDKNDSSSLKDCYEMFGLIAEKHPNLAEKLFDVSKFALQSDKNNSSSVSECYNLMHKLVMAKPELTEQLFDVVKVDIQSNKVVPKLNEYSSSSLSIYYETLGLIANFKPEMIEQVFDTFKIALQSDKNDCQSLSTYYETLDKIVKKQPKSAEQVFDLLKVALQSDKNNDMALGHAYKTMSGIIIAKPELAEKVFDTFKTTLQSDKNFHFSLGECYESLGEITKKRPELSEQVFNVLRFALQSDKNDSYAVNECYKTMSGIVITKPELAEQVFDTFKLALQTEENYKYSYSSSLSSYYEVLNKIVKKRPELAEQAFDAFKFGLQSDKNNNKLLNKCYKTMSGIVIAKPELAERVFDTLKDALQSDKNDEDSLRICSKTLRFIAQTRPELAEKVFDFTKKHDELPDRMYLYKVCMKHLPLEETIAKHPEIEQDLRIAHKGRFSTDEEFKYALENFDKKTLEKSMIFSAQQRSMNVLFSIAYLNPKIMDKIVPLTQGINDLKQKIDNKEKYSQTKIESMKIKMDNLIRKRQAWEKDGKGYPEIEKQLKEWKEEVLSFRKPDKPAAVKNYIESNQDWLIPASFKGAAIFKEYFPSYIKTILNHNKKNPADALSVHDAVYWLPEPMSKEANASFAQFVQKNIIYQDAENKDVHRPLEELKIIAQNWKTIERKLQNQEDNSELAKLKYSYVLSVCMSVKYEDQRNDDFAIEAAKHGTPEEEYHNCEDIYLAGLKVPEPFDSKKEFKEGKYIGRFLPRNDPRTLFFGDYTDCCQHYGGVGHSCAVSTVKHPFSQLFVIEDDKGKIIAGSWTWENTEGKYREVCFDNIEALGELMSRPQINKIYEQVGKYLTKGQNCHRVTIGLGFQDADVSGYAPTEAIPLPKLYGNDGTNRYTDARKQVLLAENPNAKPLDKIQESQRYIRDVCFLDKEAMDKVSYTVFPDSDRELQMPDDMSGFVIEDREKGVVGYCLFDKAKKEIYDMAVLPEYRKDKNASSSKLFAEMMRVVSKEGGEWSAEMRDKTTLRYLKAMANRGLVKYEEHGIDHTMSDGSKVVRVTFTPAQNNMQQTINKLRNQVSVGKENDGASQTSNSTQNSGIVISQTVRE